MKCEEREPSGTSRATAEPVSRDLLSSLRSDVAAVRWVAVGPGGRPVREGSRTKWRASSPPSPAFAFAHVRRPPWSAPALRCAHRAAANASTAADGGSASRSASLRPSAPVAALPAGKKQGSGHVFSSIQTAFRRSKGAMPRQPQHTWPDPYYELDRWGKKKGSCCEDLGVPSDRRGQPLTLVVAELLQLGDNAVQFLGEGIVAQGEEFVGESPVVPQGAVLAAGELGPHFLPDQPVLGESKSGSGFNV